MTGNKKVGKKRAIRAPETVLIANECSLGFGWGKKTEGAELRLPDRCC